MAAMTSPSFEPRVLPGADDVARAAAELWAAAAADALHERGRFLVALSGGSTPRAMHERLTSGAAGALPWSSTFVFFGDERCVPPDDASSNFRMARETLLSRVPVPASHVFRMEGEASDREAAARRYEETLRREARDGLDLVFLGLGVDGHTASLFPGSAALDETARLVIPAQAPANVSPRARLTLTFPAIDAARRVVFLVTGDSKRDALARVRTGSQPSVPAARVQAREVTWLVDARAAGRSV
jgi:6-phosphogluconolactonase